MYMSMLLNAKTLGIIVIVAIFVLLIWGLIQKRIIIGKIDAVLRLLVVRRNRAM